MSKKEIMLTKALVKKCNYKHLLLFRTLVWFPSPMSDGTQLPVTSVPENLTPSSNHRHLHASRHRYTHVCTYILKGEGGRLEGGREERGGRKVEDKKSLKKKK